MSEQYTNRLPYHLRAIYEWISDNGGIPSLGVCVQTTRYLDGTVPKSMYLKDKVLINISKEKVSNLNIENEKIKFGMELNDGYFEFNIPILAVLCLMDRDTKNGLKIQDSEYTDPIDIDNEISRQSIVISNSIIDKITKNL